MKTLKNFNERMIEEGTIDFKTIHQVSKPLDYARFSSKFRSTRLGSGVQTVAFKTAPGVVTKIVQLFSPNDITLRLHKMYAEHRNNFLFPRIFSAKLYEYKGIDYVPPKNVPVGRDNNGETSFFDILTGVSKKKIPMWMVIEMEELHSLKALPDHSSDYVLKPDKDFLVSMWNNSGVEVREVSKTSMVESMIKEIDKVLEEFIIYGEEDYIGKYTFCVYEMKRNFVSKYIDAVRSIQGIDSRWDLHDGNYRIRLTRYGPQLVMIDPMVHKI